MSDTTDQEKYFASTRGEGPAPGPRPAGPPAADADGAAIASLITAFFIPPLGIIFGHVSRGQARRAGREPSAIANWGTALGYLFTIAAVVLGIALGIALAKSGTQPCDPANPAWPYC